MIVEMWFSILLSKNLINNNQFLQLLLKSKTTKNCTSIFLIFAISLIIPLLMFYMPISYSQLESDEFVEENRINENFVSPMDTNGDGVVDDQDTEVVPGDTNGDGVVDDQDTEVVPGDTNGDGVVDTLDEEETTAETTTDAGTGEEETTAETTTDAGTGEEETTAETTTDAGTGEEETTAETTTDAGTGEEETTAETTTDAGTGEEETTAETTTDAGTGEEETTAETTTDAGTGEEETTAETTTDAGTGEEETTAETTTDAGTTTDTTKHLYQSQQFNCDPNSATLQVPAKGNKVIELQTYLTDLGYGDLLNPEKIDGKFGPHTKNSVKTYQKDFGLAVDGKVGPETWGSLCEQISLLPTTFPTNKIPSKDDASSTDSSQCDPNTSCPKINIIYNDVELVPQLTGYSCWAAGASMLVGWRDKVSINPEEIANAIGYWKQYQKGLEPEDTTMFKYWGLESENPQSYTVQGFANLLQDYGCIMGSIC